MSRRGEQCRSSRKLAADCWDRNQFEYFTKNYYLQLKIENKWYANHAGNENRYIFSSEWQTCRVGPYGNNNEKQIKSLSKNINEHSVSHCHKLAEDILKRQDEKALNQAFSKHKLTFEPQPTMSSVLYRKNLLKIHRWCKCWPCSSLQCHMFRHCTFGIKRDEAVIMCKYQSDPTTAHSYCG